HRRQRIAEGDGNEQRGNNAPAIPCWKPVSEVQDHAREEPGFGYPEQETQEDKAGGAGGDGCQTGNDAPGEHDAGDPPPSAYFFQHDIAWDFEQRITEKENTGAPSISISAQAEILVHGKCGKGDVGAVDVSHQVAHYYQGQQAP